jgi:uridine kinase
MPVTTCITLAGPSASGKSTLAVKLAQHPGWRLFPIDCYYRDLTHLSDEQRLDADFDHPDAIEWDLLLADLDRLLAGEPIALPAYDYSTQERTPRSTPMQPGEVVIVEGIFALVEERLRSRAQLKVYVDFPADLRLVRRLKRDVVERKIPAELVIDQWVRIVRPSSLAFIEPSRRHADLIINGSGNLQPACEKIFAAVAKIAHPE